MCDAVWSIALIVFVTVGIFVVSFIGVIHIVTELIVNIREDYQEYRRRKQAKKNV